MKKDNNFEVFYNALSIGWHLRKIKEVAPDLLLNLKDYERFEGWLERHNCNPWKTVATQLKPKKVKK